MRSSDIRHPDDLLAYVVVILKTQGRPVDPGMVVELEPLFHEVFLGGEIARLDRVIEAATAGGHLRLVGGSGRRYALTVTGAERARSIHHNVFRRLPRWQRVLIAVLVVVVLAILLL